MVKSEPPTSDGDGAMLTFPPRKGYVALATEFVRTFCAEHTDDDEAIARVQLAAHELAENVVKYSTGRKCVIRVRVTRPTSVGSVHLLITTENPVAPSLMPKVDRYLTELEQATNPDEFYDEQIAESVKRSNGSGLGLARIRSEALMHISHRVDQGLLAVSAATALPGAKGEASHG